MKQIEYVGTGKISKLADIVHELAPQKVFLVTGKGSYAASGAAKIVADALNEMDVLQYSDFGTLPLSEDIQKGVVAYTAFGPDLVIAVGGGHVMDMAKAVNFLAGKKPLIAIPTTAGTGSESTQFAVVYKGGHKTSLEDPGMLPTFAIVDPALALSVPKDVALPSALDAFCQAIESFWSNKATEESRGYARQALELIWPNIVPAIDKRDSAAITALAIGAHLAGKAINISKTTACHAFSYGLTYRFGVPHGIAVAVFLPDIYRYNSAAGDTKSIFAELNTTIGYPDSEKTVEALKNVLERFGITILSRFGVKKSDIAILASEVNADRLANNPRIISEKDISNFYSEIL